MTAAHVKWDIVVNTPPYHDPVAMRGHLGYHPDTFTKLWKAAHSDFVTLVEGLEENVELDQRFEREGGSTPSPRPEYHAWVLCKSGRHRSVAFAVGVDEFLKRVIHDVASCLCVCCPNTCEYIECCKPFFVSKLNIVTP